MILPVVTMVVNLYQSSWSSFRLDVRVDARFVNRAMRMPFIEYIYIYDYIL